MVNIAKLDPSELGAIRSGDFAAALTERTRCACQLVARRGFYPLSTSVVADWWFQEVPKIIRVGGLDGNLLVFGDPINEKTKEEEEIQGRVRPEAQVTWTMADNSTKSLSFKGNPRMSALIDLVSIKFFNKNGLSIFWNKIDGVRVYSATWKPTHPMPTFIPINLEVRFDDYLMEMIREV